MDSLFDFVKHEFKSALPGPEHIDTESSWEENTSPCQHQHCRFTARFKTLLLKGNGFS